MICGTFCFVVLFCSFLDMFGKCEATDEGEMLKKKKKKSFSRFWWERVVLDRARLVSRAHAKLTVQGHHSNMKME